MRRPRIGVSFLIHGATSENGRVQENWQTLFGNVGREILMTYTETEETGKAYRADSWIQAFEGSPENLRTHVDAECRLQHRLHFSNIGGFWFGKCTGELTLA
jgi:hypothetical protein